MIIYFFFDFIVSFMPQFLFFDTGLGPTIMQVLGQLCSGRLVLVVRLGTRLNMLFVSYFFFLKREISFINIVSPKRSFIISYSFKEYLYLFLEFKAVWSFLMKRKWLEDLLSIMYQYGNFFS